MIVKDKYYDVLPSSDEERWREVSATCMNSSRVDESTFTIAVQVYYKFALYSQNCIAL